jgi:hypothetical protein
VGLLEDFGTRRLPGDAGAEDGSPPLDFDDDAPVTDAPPTAPAAPAAAPQPKRRRSEAARPAKHVLPAAAAPEGATMDQVLQGLLVNSLAGLTSMARPPPPPPPPQRDAKTTEEKDTVEICISLLNSNMPEEQKPAVVARMLAIIDRRVARCNPSAKGSTSRSQGRVQVVRDELGPGDAEGRCKTGGRPGGEPPALESHRGGRDASLKPARGTVKPRGVRVALWEGTRRRRHHGDHEG